MARVLAAEVRLREVWAWSMYDFANSAYTTVVITAVFNAFFVRAVAGNLCRCGAYRNILRAARHAAGRR